jgi:hypothetical protein
MQKLIGKLFYWNGRIGLIEARIPEHGGYKIARYFLHCSQIVFEPEQISKDQVVRFTTLDRKPAPGKLPFAGDAEIYESLEQLQAAEKGGEAVQS